MFNRDEIPKLAVHDRLLIFCGIAAPVVLLLAVIIAGSLHPGYSHISQAISEFGAQGAPHRAILSYAGLVPAGVLTRTPPAWWV